MTQGDLDYAKAYAAMADEELLTLTRDVGTLTDAAQAALREEVDRRRLGSNVDQESVLVGGQGAAGGGQPDS